MIKYGAVGPIKLYVNEPKTFVRTEPSIRADMDRRMTVVQRQARRKVRVRTGTLLSTIRKNGGVDGRGLYVDVIAGGRGARYAAIENFGSKPHRIAARRRKALRFMQGGRVQFRRAVWHPGTKGSFFLTDSLIFAAS